MDWTDSFERAPNVWSYVRTHDNNFAFHVHNRQLSLACCKGSTIRKSACQDDIVVALTSVVNGKELRVSGIFKISESIPRQKYYDRFAKNYNGLDARHGKTGRIDNIYNDNCLLMNDYHRPDNYGTGVLNDMKSNHVILSTEFSCFGWGTPTCPGIPVPHDLTAIPYGHPGAPRLKLNGAWNPKYKDAKRFCSFLAGRWQRREEASTARKWEPIRLVAMELEKSGHDNQRSTARPKIDFDLREKRKSRMRVPLT